MDNLRNTLANFFNNRYTRHEYFCVYSGFEENDQFFLEEMEKQWDEADSTVECGFKQEHNWRRLSEHIDCQSGAYVRSVTVFWRFAQKVAAFLFLPLLVTSLVFLYSLNTQPSETAWVEIVCPAGVRTEFRLPDGSTGFLNSRSELRYHVNAGILREVYLSGEAFFEVAPDNDNTFRVITRKLETEVLGTSFNIMAYKDQPYEEITLKTGRLKIFDRNRKELSSLIADCQFVYDTLQGQSSVNQVNTESYTSWTEGKLIIQDERFEDGAKKLSRWYDVVIEIEDVKLKDYRYFATFVDEPLDEVLKLIAMTAPIRYIEMPRKQLEDGSFSKRTIKLRLNDNRMNNFN